MRGSSRIALTIGLCLMLLLGMVGIGTAAPIRIVMQQNSSLEHPWQHGLLHIAKAINEGTNGKYKAEVFGNGVLCQRNWKLMLEQTQTGSSQLMVESTTAFSTLVPEVFAFNLPFLYSDQNHLARLLKNPPDVVKKWYKKFEEKDLVVVGAWIRPPRQLINNVRPVRSPADIKGLKFRVPPNPIFVKVFEAMGAKPVPLPSGEIYTAIQLGTVSGEDNSVGTVYDFKTYEVTKYMTIWNYMGDAVLVVMNKPFWDKLPGDVKNLITKAAAEAGDIVAKEEEELQEKAIAKMKQAGIQFYYMTEKEKEPFKKLMKPIYDEYEKLLGPADWKAYLEAIEAVRQ